MIVATIGAGGGVGTSTVALLLAAALNEQTDRRHEVALVEADHAGGVAGARFELGVADGLQAWVAGLATEPNLPVSGFGKRIADGLQVVPGPVSRVDAERVLTPAITEMLATAMTADHDRWWIVDIGRGSTASAPIQQAADMVVIVSSGLAEHVVRLPSLVAAARPAPSVVMLGGSSVWSADEVQSHCRADTVIDGPDLRLPSSQVVDLIEGRRRRRSMVWRSVLRARDRVVTNTAVESETRIERQAG